MAGSNQVTYDGGSTPFANPVGLFVDSSGKIYVADTTNGLVYRFDDMTGSNQVTYGGGATPFGGGGLREIHMG